MPTDDSLLEAVAVHAVCHLLTRVQLEDMQRSVEHACRVPPNLGWGRKATATRRSSDCQPATGERA